MDEIARAWLGLWLISGLGPKTIATLVQAFGGIENLMQANGSEIHQRTNLDKEKSYAVTRAADAEATCKEVEEIERLGLTFLHWGHPRYPHLLEEIHQSPPVLYQKGTLDLNEGLFLAFVGSRKASFSGKSLTKRLVGELAGAQPQIRIVSGLALGIDTAAHAAALECHLPTVAVLAGGLSRIYPAQNQGLAQAIVDQGGCWLTEFPTATQPLAQHFPLRNRIISGLSRGVVVSEAGERSGASITANLALDQGRELFALPGPADSKFHLGTNRLIQRGSAKLILSAEDILVELAPGLLSSTSATPSSPLETPGDLSDEAAILKALEEGAQHADELAQKLNLPQGKLLGLLTTLEIQGLIFQKSGSLYQRL